MSAVKEYFEATRELIDLLRTDNLDRDEKLQMVEELLNKRDDLITLIKPPYSQEDKEIGRQLLQLERVLSKLLDHEKVLIQKDMKELTVKKGTTNKYANPYDSLAIDGIYYDKRN